MELRLCAFADEAAADTKEQIGALSRNGISLVEVRGANGKNVADLTVDEAKAYADKLGEAGIRTFSLGSQLGKMRTSDDFKPERERLDRLIRAAHVLGCKRIRIFGFLADEEADRDTALNRLGYFVCRAADGGIQLCHENKKNTYGDTPARVNALLDEIGGLGSVYNPANYIRCGVSPDASLPLVDRADYLRISDSTAIGEIVPAGEGDGKIGNVIDRFNRDGVATIESYWRISDGYVDWNDTRLADKHSSAMAGQAFDRSVAAFKTLLTQKGFIEQQGKWVR